MVMIIANPLAMSKFLGGNGNGTDIFGELFVDFKLVDEAEVDMFCKIGSTSIRPVDSGFWMNVYGFIFFAGDTSSIPLDHPAF